MRFVVDIPKFPDISPHEVTSRWKQYDEYIRSLAGELPPHAFAYATSEWQHDYRHQLSPHDAWLERLAIVEPATGGRAEQRSIAITIELLGSYNDGRIRFTYPDVRSYAFSAPAEFEMPPYGVGHGDWLADEVQLVGPGAVAHEILFSRGAQWRIEASDLLYEWIPSH